MPKSFWTLLLLITCAQAQSAGAPTSPATNAPKPPSSEDDLFPAHKLNGKVGLVRGVLKHVDPIHDQLVIHAFGGGDMRVAFDGRTQLAAENKSAQLTGLAPGSLLSVDTMIDNGKLYARSVRTSASRAVELSGQIVRYDPTRSEIILRDPISPQSIDVHLTPNTKVINGAQQASAGSLSDGMLVRVWYESSQRTANEVEILAKPGSSFTFQGRIVAVDLRSRVLSLSNETDQSLREIAFGSLNSSSLSALQENAYVSIEAEFDGERYNLRSITAVPHNP
jgi:hypothetical protein